MKNKIIILSLVTALSINTFAEQKEITSKEQVERIQQQKSGVESSTSEIVSLRDADIERKSVDDYRDAIIALYIEDSYTRNFPTDSGKHTIMLHDNIKDIKKEEAAKRREKKQKEETSAKARKLYTRGYCSFLNTVDVSELVSFAEVECMLDGIGNARMSIQIYPQHSAKALVAKPVYIVPDGANQNNRLQVQEGVVLNGLRTSLNIASIVNDRKIEKMLAAGLLSTNTIVSEESLRYMDALEESKQQEGSQVIPGTGGSAPIVVQNKNTRKPDVQDYVTIAGIKLVSSLVGILGESMINDLPYLYRIEQGQRIYFDGLLVENTLSNETGPVNFTNSSIVKKSLQSIKVDKNGNVSFVTNGKPEDDTKDLQIEEQDELSVSPKR